MPTKSRRSRAKQQARMKKAQAGTAPVQRAPAAAAPSAPKVAAPAPASPAAAASMPAPGLHYAYVTRELKRIGIVAGISVVVLLVLSFALR